MTSNGPCEELPTQKYVAEEYHNSTTQNASSTALARRYNVRGNPEFFVNKAVYYKQQYAHTSSNINIPNSNEGFIVKHRPGSNAVR